MCTIHKDLEALGDDLNDEDFSAMLLGSLPQSYDSYLSAVTAALSVLGTKLTLDALMLCQRTRARTLRFMLKVGPENNRKVGRDRRRVSSVLIATRKGM